jgi:hypothetical protein
MKNIKKIISVVSVVGVIGMASAAYAAEIQSPSDIVSSITGKTIEEVQSERAEGKTYGTIASESGVLDEFKTEILEQKKLILDERVADGNLTQEEADEIYTKLQENQLTCDGTGLNKIGQNYGLSFGNGNGNGLRKGEGKGNGNGLKDGSGNGTCDYDGDSDGGQYRKGNNTKNNQ